jgi:hypothetical protein
MSERQQALADAESEQLAAVRAAIQIGIDHFEAGTYEDVDDPHAWVHEIAQTVTTQSGA